MIICGCWEALGPEFAGPPCLLLLLLHLHLQSPHSAADPSSRSLFCGGPEAPCRQEGWKSSGRDEHRGDVRDRSNAFHDDRILPLCGWRKIQPMSFQPWTCPPWRPRVSCFLARHKASMMIRQRLLPHVVGVAAAAAVTLPLLNGWPAAPVQWPTLPASSPPAKNQTAISGSECTVLDSCCWLIHTCTSPSDRRILGI